MVSASFFKKVHSFLDFTPSPGPYGLSWYYLELSLPFLVGVVYGCPLGDRIWKAVFESSFAPIPNASKLYIPFAWIASSFDSKDLLLSCMGIYVKIWVMKFLVCSVFWGQIAWHKIFNSLWWLLKLSFFPFVASKHFQNFLHNSSLLRKTCH